ncbi:hypothetical protein [Spirosoma gilvum]
MEQIRQLLQSYAYFRGAVLRKIEDSRFAKFEYKAVFGHDSHSIYRRRSNAQLWRPAEIHKLAYQLGLWDGMGSRLQKLADLIQQLPSSEKKAVYKTAGLTDEKLELHKLDPDLWLPRELEKIQGWCAKQLVSNPKSKAAPTSKGKLGSETNQPA